MNTTSQNPSKPPSRPLALDDEPIVVPISLAHVGTRGVEWLWPGRVPIGRVSLMAGEPGVGKSLIALDVAARISRAAPWPEEGSGFGVQGSDSVPEPRTLNPPASTLLLSAEDDVADTIRPRLEAAGADCHRIIAIPAHLPAKHSQGHNVPRLLDLRRDLAHLDRLLEKVPDCRLVIVDPLGAYLSGMVENVNAEARNLIGLMNELAARRRLAILAITHLRKQSGSAIQRTMGSLAWVAAARAAWLVAADPADRERRLMLPLKNNLSANETGLAYTIESTPNDAPIISWHPDPITTSPDEVLKPKRAPIGRPSDERDDAIRWLRGALAAGPRQATKLEEDAKGHGIRLATLRRAFRFLGGQAHRVGGKHGQWHWQLPFDGQNPPADF